MQDGADDVEQFEESLKKQKPRVFMNGKRVPKRTLKLREKGKKSESND
ncbi:MAG: hypothetical protein V3W44_06715 [Dehalococcoidales bacterium]